MFKTIHSLTEIPELFDKDSLLVFDIDDTLVVRQDMILRMPHCNSPFAKALRAEFIKKCRFPEDPAYHILIENIAYTSSKHRLIESLFPDLFAKFIEIGKKAIGLTLLPSGPCGKLPSLEKWREEELKSYNIDFSKTSPFSADSFSFTEFKAPHGRFPVYHKGVVLTCEHSKGQVLTKLLKKHNYFPSKIVFIDDLTSNLIDVQTALKSHNIDFQGYLYKGYEKVEGVFNPETARKQITHLIEHEEWLSDTEF